MRRRRGSGRGRMSHSEINIVKKIYEWIDVEQFNKCKIMECDAHCFIQESSIEQLDGCDRRMTDPNEKKTCVTNLLHLIRSPFFLSSCIVLPLSLFSSCCYCYSCCYCVVLCSLKHLFSLESELRYCVLCCVFEWKCHASFSLKFCSRCKYVGLYVYAYCEFNGVFLGRIASE